MFGSVTEPNYRDFAFSPELLRHAPGAGAILEGVFAPWGDNQQITLTEQGVKNLIAASIITSPFVFQRPEFSAPRPVKPNIWAPPQDPTFSGKWGQPLQTEIPPEPKVRLKPIDLRLLGFPLSPINRAINEGRQRRAEERLAKEKEGWRQRLQAIQIKNQEAVSEFERKVHATSEYKACLAEYRRWLQAAERLEAEYQAALQRWNFLREAFEKDRESEIARLMQLQAACAEGKPEAVSQVVATAIENSNRWWIGKGDHLVRYDRETKTLLVNYEFPDVEKFAFCKPGAKDTLKSVAKTQRREFQERLA